MHPSHYSLGDSESSITIFTSSMHAVLPFTAWPLLWLMWSLELWFDIVKEIFMYHSFSEMLWLVHEVKHRIAAKSQTNKHLPTFDHCDTIKTKTSLELCSIVTQFTLLLFPEILSESLILTISYDLNVYLYKLWTCFPKFPSPQCTQEDLSASSGHLTEAIWSQIDETTTGSGHCQWG